MQALASHLKRRNQKILEEELSLPKIPEVVQNQFTRTSIRVKHTRPVIKYVSETTFSPEEEHVHQQLKMALNKPDPHPVSQNSRIIELLKGKEPIKEKRVLPKIKGNNTSTSKADTPTNNESSHASVRRKTKSVNSKLTSLNNIFLDRNQFIKNYFADINDRLNR